ncbi:hypothetical protein AAAC51_08595 [Priestia megaterium]
MDDKGCLTQRFIIVYKICPESIKAWCLLRNEKRTFKMENILSYGFSDKRKKALDKSFLTVNTTFSCHFLSWRMEYVHILYPLERGMDMTSKQGNETKHTAKGRAKQTDMTIQKEQKQHQAKMHLYLIIIVGQILMEID